MKKIFFFLLFAPIILLAQDPTLRTFNVELEDNNVQFYWSTYGSVQPSDFKMLRGVNENEFQEAGFTWSNDEFSRYFQAFDTLEQDGDIIYYELWRYTDEEAYLVKRVTIYDGPVALAAYSVTISNNIILKSNESTTGHASLWDPSGNDLIDSTVSISNRLSIFDVVRGNYVFIFEAAEIEVALPIKVE